MRAAAVLLIVVAGCGPAKIGGSSTSETDSSGADGDPTGAEVGTTAGEGTTDDEDTTVGFVPDYSSDDCCMCDPIAQDCSEGEKCVAYASGGENWDANKCVVVSGTGGVGEACVYAGTQAASDDCDAASVCWNAAEVEGVFVGTCTPFCTGTGDDPTCVDPQTSCRIGNEGSIAVCLLECDPLLQDCGAGLGCSWSASGAFHCVAVAKEWHAATGEPCGFNNDCDPGNFCAPTDAHEGCMGAACCATYCELGQDPSPCAPNYMCLPFFADGTAPEEHADLGICVAMAAPAETMPDAW